MGVFIKYYLVSRNRKRPRLLSNTISKANDDFIFVFGNVIRNCCKKKFRFLLKSSNIFNRFPYLSF